MDTRNYSISVAAAKVSRFWVQDKVASTRKSRTEVCIRDRGERACGWRLEGSPGCVESETPRPRASSMHIVYYCIHRLVYILWLASSNSLDPSFWIVIDLLRLKMWPWTVGRAEVSTCASALCNTSRSCVALSTRAFVLRWISSFASYLGVFIENHSAILPIAPNQNLNAFIAIVND